MENVKVLLFTLLGLFSQNLFCQIDPENLVIVKDKFYYQNKIYNKKNIDELLFTNEKAYGAFKQSEARKRLGNGVIVSSILLGLGSAYIIKREGEISKGEIRDGLILALIPTTLSLFCYRLKRKKIEKAVKLFNDGNQSTDLGKVPMKFMIGNTSDGIGLVFNF